MKLEARVDPKDLSALYQSAKAAEGTVQIELRRAIKAAAKPLVDGVKSQSAFSSRIPGAVKSKASFAKKGASVSIYVDSAKAPEAAPINNRGKSGKFRHPVYGNRENWVNQTAHPFFEAGLREGDAACDRAMRQVMDDIAKKLGFH